ncbi:MAG: aminotransferase class V-fold PLP-dependent enzyme [Pseudomonadota bacterium]
MSLRFGRPLLAIPGPSIIPDRVLNAMHRASPNIYEGELIEIADTLYPDLRTVAQTSGQVAIYISNGHGAWEAALKNTLVAGDRVLVLATGRFAANWGKMAESHGIEVDVLDFGMQSPAHPDAVEAALRADTDGKIKAVLTVQGDTASSVLNDIPALRAAIDASGSDALFMVDCIASLACDRFEMDKWGVDLMVAGCQKGLMTPAGISFVFFNDRARAARQRASPGQYWDWVQRTEGTVFYQKFAGTAPTHHIFGLREALDILVHEEGIEAAWKRHETIARAVWAALDVWGEGDALHHNVAEPNKRTVAVSTVTTGPGLAVEIRKWCEQEAGVTLGISLGFGEPGSPEWACRFRIGHMGHLNLPMVMGVLGSIDCALKALDIPHGDTALAAAASVLSQH